MFAGILTHSGGRPERFFDPERLLAALTPFVNPDAAGHWTEGPCLLAQAHVCNTRESRNESVPYRCPGTNVAMAFWGRLDDRAALAAAVGIPADRLNATSDTHLIAAAWERWGTSCVEHLLGDFAFAILDPTRQQAFLARDPMGIRPLYYKLDGDALVFATTAAVFPLLRDGAPEPDRDWMVRFLVDQSKSRTATAYRGVLKLPPGHTLRIGAGPAEPRPYFQLVDDAPHASHRDSRWVDAYREKLEDAIRYRMRSEFPLGSENSGGIDSATVTAYLAHFLGDPGDRLHAFGFARLEQEAEHIFETSIRHGIVHNYTVSGPAEWTDEDAQRTLTVLGYPPEHGTSTHHTPFYRECAQRGIRTLFSGFGGDEVVTNHGGLLHWELLDQHAYRALGELFQGNPVARGLRLARFVAARRKRPAYKPGLAAATRRRWESRLVRDEDAERLCLFDLQMEAARYDAPYRRVNDFAISRAQEAFVATRLENCTLLAASYGVEYRWPLWDVRLVQQYLSTPAIEKYGPSGVSRYLHRRAIEGVVPPKIQWKITKAMGDPVGEPVNAGKALAEVVRAAQRHDANLHPQLADLIDRARLRDQIEWVRSGAAGDRIAQGQFRRNVASLGWLNQWLHGTPVG